MLFDPSQSAYRAFRDIAAERTRSIYPWVGAGLSVPAGLPTWDELRRLLCDELREQARRLETTEADQRRAERITNNANQAQAHGDIWVSFRILRKSLGETTFRESIRKALSAADSASPPKTYESLWRLRPGGIITLNLDQMASRAFAIVNPGKPITQFDGKSAGRHTHALKSPHPFIANVHGRLSDTDGWVFTKDDLRSLLSDPAYKMFVASCLTGGTVLFVGMTADDPAIATHLEALQEIGVDFGAHYWLTDRTDTATSRRADRLGIRLIQYRNSDGQHAGVGEFISDLLAYIPAEANTFPVALPTTRVSADSDLSGLDRKTTEELRQTLNAQATRILTSGGSAAYLEYERFVADHNRWIYLCWYIDTKPPDNVLIGHTIEGEIGKGAFGRVYRAKAKDQSVVAIKVLHQDVRRIPAMLQSFRRGVQSMRILSESKLAGMVPMIEASEIPACVVMEYVEGPDLGSAVESGHLNEWDVLLRVACDIARIVGAAHGLPARVLHRDLRPSNIMLKNFYTQPDDWSVVILDFDLSWHRDAAELSVQPHSSVGGYAAPEQLERTGQVSTRSALVDSFGIGMTLFFMLSLREPLLAEQRHVNWEQTLKSAADSRPNKVWRSLPQRFARLVRMATRDRQHERWDMSQIERELQRLREANQNPRGVSSAELLAEEVSVKSGFTENSEATWDADKLAMKGRLLSGMNFVIRGEESRHEVVVEMTWSRRLEEDWRRVAKWIGPASTRAAAALRSAGWNVQPPNSTSASAGIVASADVELVRKEMAQIVRGLVAGAEALRFR